MADHEPIKDQEETTKDPFPIDGVQWISETIDLRQFYRIKGKAGLYIAESVKNKSGLIRMKRWTLDEAYTVNIMDLVHLSDFRISRSKAQDIDLGEAFDNLQYELHNKAMDVRLMTEDEEPINWLSVICPGYDPYQFKLYHAKWIWKWYNEIITSLERISAVEEIEKTES